MKRFSLVKGKTYLIDGILHLFQERDNGIYKFLKIDGSQKYLYEKDLDKIKPTLQDQAYEQKLRNAEIEISYYKEKYEWYSKKDQQIELQKKYEKYKSVGWFSDNKHVQFSALLTMIASMIGAIIIASQSHNFWAGALQFVILIIIGAAISLMVAWVTHRLFDFLDFDIKSNLKIVTSLLLFYLPLVWYIIYRVGKLLLSLKQGTE